MRVLFVQLMKACAAKVDGFRNPQYGSKLNFYLALAASGNTKACEYFSENLVGVGL